MTSVNIKARFKGTDGSLGYRIGTTYFLQVEEKGLARAPAIMASLPYAGKCPYGSWEAFWHNWEKA